jgi:ribosomal protein L5
VNNSHTEQQQTQDSKCRQVMNRQVISNMIVSCILTTFCTDQCVQQNAAASLLLLAVPVAMELTAKAAC